MPTDLDAVTLDLFGTLVDFDVRRDEPPLVARLLAELGARADAGEVLGTWFEKSMAERAKTPFRTVRQALSRGAARAGAHHGLDLDPEHWTQALEDLWASRPLVADVPEALDRLEHGGLPVALVTNLDRSVLRRVLEATGLGERVRVAVTSEHARAYKPHPRVFRMALEALGVEPARALHIGNSAGEDRAGAVAAGMRCRLVRGGHPGLLEVLDELDI